MRKVFIWSLIFSALLSAGCVKKERPAVTIGPIAITAEEFQQAYEKAQNTGGEKISRKEFLDVLIKRKLMLKEAETLGLDKDSQFLEGLQVFWEQSLLKLVLARKLNELSLIAGVSEKEITDYYQRHREKDYQGLEISQVHDQIKMLLSRIKQQLEIQRWIASLKRRARINVDYDLLQIPKDK
jgi:hypothetical protein